jgi:uncharacterized membrane protein (UPF0127 family)
MNIIEITNTTRPLIRPINANYCDGFFCWFLGLMFRRTLEPEEGLLRAGKRENLSDSTIHMLFMFVDLTVVWLNDARQVVDVKIARRWRLFYAPQSPAKYVLELPVDRFDEFQIGDQLQFDENHLD